MKRIVSILIVLAVVGSWGCSSSSRQVQKEPEIPPQRQAGEYLKPGVQYAIDVYDPWERMNRAIYNFNAVFDNYVFLPVVNAYEFVLPDIVQTGIGNFYRNLTEVTNLTNCLLQGKVVRAVETFGRICINTTVGLGGLIDVATINDHIERADEDFGQTLGVWGVPQGPYLVLPILGPSTVRDTAGTAVDSLVYSEMLSHLIGLLRWDERNEQILNYSMTAVYAIDKRHGEPFRYYKSGSPFEYDLIRKLYLLKREFQVKD